MKKILLTACLAVIIGFVVRSYAISSFTYFWTIKLAGDTATVVKWKANNDSVLAFATRATDTMNKGIPRWKGFSNHDSTFKWMNIDTIPSADTMFLKNLKVTKIDSILKLVTDSIYARSYRGKKGIIDTVVIDSLKARTINGAVNGTVDTLVTDSIKARTIISSTVTAITGNFDTLGTDTIRCRKIYDSGIIHGSFKINLTGLKHATLDTILWEEYTYPDTVVYLHFGYKSDSSNATTFVSDSTIPVSIRPSKHSRSFPISLLNNDIIEIGTITINTSGQIAFNIFTTNGGDPGGFPSAETTGAFYNANLKGYYPFTLIYKK